MDSFRALEAVKDTKEFWNVRIFRDRRYKLCRCIKYGLKFFFQSVKRWNKFMLFFFTIFGGNIRHNKSLIKVVFLVFNYFWKILLQSYRIERCRQMHPVFLQWSRIQPITTKKISTFEIIWRISLEVRTNWVYFGHMVTPKTHFYKLNWSVFSSVKCFDVLQLYV